MKTCACGTIARPNQRTCLGCHREYQKSWRHRNPMTREQRFRSNARSYLHVYLKRGQIVRQPCEACGDVAQPHHPDYSKPLQVRWLCKFHHQELHNITRGL